MRFGLVLAAAVATGVSTPAVARPEVFLDQAAFLQRVSGAASYGFDSTFPANEVSIPIGSPFRRGPAVFEGDLAGYTDIYPVEYLGAYRGTFTASTNRAGIGFELGSYYGEQSIRYSVGGFSGSLALPAENRTAFIGFVGLGSGDRISFVGSDEIDVLSFVAAVPEPATWALMIVGFGAVGGRLRRGRHLHRADGASCTKFPHSTA